MVKLAVSWDTGVPVVFFAGILRGVLLCTLAKARIEPADMNCFGFQALFKSPTAGFWHMRKDILIFQGEIVE